MTLLDLADALRRRWLVVIAGLLVGAGAGCGFLATAAPSYRATATAFVSAAGGAAGTALQGSQYALQQVGSYATVATSASVLQEVADERALGESVGDLRGRVVASSPDGTVLVSITATGPTAVDAADLADRVAVRFTAVVQDLARQDGGGQPTVEVTVVQRAAGAATGSGSSSVLVVAAGLLTGLLAGAAAALLHHLLSGRLERPQDVVALTGRWPLGVVASRRRPAADVAAAAADATWTEGFRTVRDALELDDPDRPPRVLLVTSAVQGEGKSTASCHLALALAAAGHRVLLVDADLRRPAVAQRLGLEPSVGLVDVLAGKLALEDALQPALHPGLSVLAAGRTPPDPGALVGSRQMRSLLERARDVHDVVVVDAPPVLPVTDACVLLGAVDGAVLVVRARRTRRAELAEAVERLGQSPGRVLGTVLSFAHRRDVPHARFEGLRPATPDPRGAWPPVGVPAAAGGRRRSSDHRLQRTR